MSNKVCFFYTDTNGLHTVNKDVNKKYIYGIARLVSLHYSIGTYVDNKYVEEKRVNVIVKPECISFDETAVSIHKITKEKAEKEGKLVKDVMTELKEDLKKVKYIVSHNVPFHIKPIQVECFRTYTSINFSKFTYIDTISYNHNFDFPKLQNLKTKLKVKNTRNQLDIIQKVFDELYKKSV